MKKALFLSISLSMLFPMFSIAQARTAASQNTVRKIPVREFFRNPEKAYFQVSPGGTYISYTAPYEGRMNIFVMKRGEREGKRITSFTDRDLSGYFWKGDNRILFVKDFGGDENYHLYSVKIDGTEKEKDITPFDGVKVDIIDDMVDHDTDVLISSNQRNREIFDVYRLNTATGEMKMVAENPGNITQWITDHEYKIRAAVVTDGVNTSLLYRSTEADTFSVVTTIDFKETLQPVLFTFDNKNLYALSNLNRDKTVLIEFDPVSRKEIKVIHEDQNYDLDGVNYSKKRKVLTYISVTTWKPEKKFLDKETEELFATLKTKFPDHEVEITFQNRNEDVMTVRTWSDRTLGSYYVFDKATGSIAKLADRNPWIKEEEMAHMMPMTIKTRDGLDLQCYLTVPPGKGRKGLPVVVNPHGGPWARDIWGFNEEAQFLANRGYGVLQVNFRGSTGFGKKFWMASFKEWGLKMQDDITDAVQYLTDNGIADKNRIAIYGASYGGYATLAGLTFTPDLYACGVDYVGVSNLFTFLKTIPPYWKPYLQMMYEMVGDPEKDKALFERTSPALNAGKINDPLFIAQGAKDPRVNKAESDQMVEALRKQGVKVEYMVKENEGHGFSNEENRFEFYEAMDKFLGKYIGEPAK